MRPTNSLQWGALIVSVVVFAIIVAGLVASGSPLEERTRQRDKTRGNNLSLIQSQITNYWGAKNKLPDSLDILKDPTRYVFVPVDPSTGKQYGYEKTGDKTFRLCADFEMKGSGMAYSENISWDHEKGHVCFDRSIDPDFYPQKGAPLKSAPLNAVPAPYYPSDSSSDTYPANPPLPPSGVEIVPLFKD